MGGNENYLIYQFGDGTWNDLPNFHNVIRGYIVEYTHPQALAQASVPAPPIVAMLLPALVMIWGRIRQNRRNAQ